MADKSDESVEDQEETETRQIKERPERDSDRRKAEPAVETYGSAVLAKGEIEEEVILHEDALTDTATHKAVARTPEERDESALAEKDTLSAASEDGSRDSSRDSSRESSPRNRADSTPESTPRESSRPSDPPRKPIEQVAMKPPVLASESLRKEVAPLDPGRITMRALLLFFGLAGTISSFLLVRFMGMGAPIAGAFFGLALLGVIPIPHVARSVAAVTIAACVLALATWMNLGRGALSPVIVEITGITLLSAGLFFRAWHRASALSRMMVAVGVALTGSWLAMSGALSNFSTLDPSWQSWLPIVLRAPLALLMMLSLLAFMDERSTGGCGLWATGIVLWEGLNSGVQLLVRFWPSTLDAPDWSLVSGAATLPAVVSPLLITLVAFGSAQLLAAAAAVQPVQPKKKV